MPGIYRPRHPERTVLYRVLFHNFDRFLTAYESRFEKEYGYFRPVIREVVERYLDCGNPRSGFARIFFKFRRKLLGELCRAAVRTPVRVVAFLTDYAVVDRIIRHLKLTFATERPPPSRFFVEVALMVRIPSDSGHIFRRKAATIPTEAGHIFRREGGHF